MCATLGIELTEIQGWVCCGATPTASFDYEISLGLGMKNLGMVNANDSIVTPCSACFKNLKNAEVHMKDIKAQTPNVRHLFQTIYDDVGLEIVKSKVVNPLKGLKVVSYYGCLLTRVDPRFDSPENPVKMDKLAVALGAEALPFAYKMKCCGGPVILSKHDLSVTLAATILKAAKATGAHAIMVLCPMCGTMLDLYQKEALKGGEEGHIPIAYFTQLMALSFGLVPEDVALSLNTVSSRPIFEALTGGGR